MSWTWAADRTASDGAKDTRIYMGGLMTHRRIAVLSVLAAGCLVQGIGPGMAQINPFGLDPNTASLTDEDWRLLSEATVTLNRAPNAAAGETRSWSNAVSGDSGKVSVMRVFQSNGATCHAVRYAILFPHRSTPQEYNVNWCRTTNGQWKIAP
jgi:surface antigen